MRVTPAVTQPTGNRKMGIHSHIRWRLSTLTGPLRSLWPSRSLLQAEGCGPKRMTSPQVRLYISSLSILLSLQSAGNCSPQWSDSSVNLVSRPTCPKILHALFRSCSLCIQEVTIQCPSWVLEGNRLTVADVEECPPDDTGKLASPSYTNVQKIVSALKLYCFCFYI